MDLQDAITGCMNVSGEGVLLSTPAVGHYADTMVQRAQATNTAMYEMLFVNSILT